MRKFLLLAAAVLSIVGLDAQGQTPDPMLLMARVHFAGADKMTTDPSAQTFRSIAALAETRALKEQTLNKLSRAPFEFYRKEMANTNDYASLFRPMMENLWASESYLEVHGVPNRTPEIVLAVRADNAGAQAWRTNLAAILTSWSGVQTAAFEEEGFSGFELKKHDPPNRLKMAQAGAWVVVGLGQDDLQAMDAMLKKIKAEGNPAPALGGLWAEGWIDWAHLREHYPELIPFDLPRMQFAVSNRADNVHWKVDMVCDQMPETPLPGWQAPTNIICNPLTSFTAMRGIRPLLDQFSLLKILGVEPLESQTYLWSIAGMPFGPAYLASPQDDGMSVVRTMAPRLAAYMSNNPALARMGEVAFNPTNGEIALIHGVPMVIPSIRPVHEPAGSYILAGLFPPAHTKQGFPTNLLEEIKRQPDLVYYDWEITAEHLMQSRGLVTLYSLEKGQVLPSESTVAQRWLDAMSPVSPAARGQTNALPRTFLGDPKTGHGNCVTEITLSGRNRMVLTRSSAVGLTASELAWLGRWLDAPGFPYSTAYPIVGVVAPRRGMPLSMPGGPPH